MIPFSAAMMLVIIVLVDFNWALPAVLHEQLQHVGTSSSVPKESRGKKFSWSRQRDGWKGKDLSSEYKPSEHTFASKEHQITAQTQQQMKPLPPSLSFDDRYIQVKYRPMPVIPEKITLIEKAKQNLHSVTNKEYKESRMEVKKQAAVKLALGEKLDYISSEYAADSPVSNDAIIKGEHQYCSGGACNLNKHQAESKKVSKLSFLGKAKEKMQSLTNSSRQKKDKPTLNSPFVYPKGMEKVEKEITLQKSPLEKIKYSIQGLTEKGRQERHDAIVKEYRRKENERIQQYREKEYEYLKDVATADGPSMTDEEKESLRKLHNEFRRPNAYEHNFYDKHNLLPKDQLHEITVPGSEEKFQEVRFPISRKLYDDTKRYKALMDKSTLKGILNKAEQKELIKLHKDFTNDPNARKMAFWNKIHLPPAGVKFEMDLSDM